MGWLEKATDDAPAEPPRAACRLAPARPFEYPGRRDIDPVQPGANPRNVQTPQSHPAQSTPMNRPGMSGDSSSWKGWGHVRWFIEEVPAGAA
ncbi:hypothetical protein DSJ83_13775 [Mycobacterium tuberculosis]|nr:hypothetical protein DSJ83_13775 [Mycobacterium tuberculosis]REZ19478.1 hypothetical protein DSL38_20990 [Mycobacterium tuberculosis]RXR83828.1 hypothetical protein EUA95_15795 [Mycobacterium tuberculosis]